MTTPPSSPVSSLSSDRRSEPPSPDSPCQALLSDEVTVCAGRARGRGRYCAEHGWEYRTLTRAYKEASEAVLVLDKLVLPRRTDVLTLHNVAAVDDAVAVTERYLEAIEVEIEGRRRHHRRFFQTKDDGHEHWLKSLQTKKGAAAAFLERLRARRRDLVMAKEAVKTFQEGLRRIELAALEEQRNKRSVDPLWSLLYRGSPCDHHRSDVSIRGPPLSTWKDKEGLQVGKQCPLRRGRGVLVILGAAGLSSGSSWDGCCCAFGWYEWVESCTTPR